MHFSILSFLSIIACDTAKIDLETTSGDFEDTEDETFEQGDTGGFEDGSDGSDGSDDSKRFKWWLC